MTLAQTLRRVLDTQRLLTKQHALIQSQQRLIDELLTDNHRVRLQAIREMHGMVSGWLLSLEQPEIDVRHDLAELDLVLCHQIARLEEHVL